jgi:hypothetical protein
MPDSVQRRSLDQRPDEATIGALREEANEAGASVEASFPATDGTEKRLVVSPRGTVVLLNDVSEATFNQSVSAAEIAEALRED